MKSRFIFTCMWFSLFSISACGDDAPTLVPGAPELTRAEDSFEISWDPIAGADTYNLYIHEEENCPDILAVDFIDPTANDTKMENVTSPFSIAEYKTCNVCYYAAVRAENEVGEGPFSQATGWQITPCE